MQITVLLRHSQGTRHAGMTRCCHGLGGSQAPGAASCFTNASTWGRHGSSTSFLSSHWFSLTEPRTVQMTRGFPRGPKSLVTGILALFLPHLLCHSPRPCPSVCPPCLHCNLLLRPALLRGPAERPAGQGAKVTLLMATAGRKGRGETGERALTLSVRGLGTQGRA